LFGAFGLVQLTRHGSIQGSNWPPTFSDSVKNGNRPSGVIAARGVPFDVHATTECV
jgi:hypothetical protein